MGDGPNTRVCIGGLAVVQYHHSVIHTKPNHIDGPTLLEAAAAMMASSVQRLAFKWASRCASLC